MNVFATVQNVYIFLPYIIPARTDGIDRNEKIMSRSPYLSWII